MQDAVEPFTAEVRANFDRFIHIQIELACLQQNDAYFYACKKPSRVSEGEDEEAHATDQAGDRSLRLMTP